MPRHRINVAKLHALKDQLHALASAREIYFHHRCTRFDRNDRARWERAVGRAWRRYYNAG